MSADCASSANAVIRSLDGDGNQGTESANEQIAEITSKLNDYSIT